MREVLAIPGLESVYLITHDVDLALTHADRILLFRDGRIVADGPPKEVIADDARWSACNLRAHVADAGERAVGCGATADSSTPSRWPSGIVAAGQAGTGGAEGGRPGRRFVAG